MLENGDTLMKGMTSSPQARLGFDFLHWPETVCSWTLGPPAVALRGGTFTGL